VHPLGILGGTFDPIHYGHLRPAAEAQTVLGLSGLRLIPAARPPHRDPPVASASDRLAMARLAVEEFPGMTVDERECHREGLSYTVVTLESLRAELGADVPLCLLVGADAFSGFTSWHRWQAIPAMAHLAVLRRPDSAVAREPATWPEWARARAAENVDDLAREPAGKVFFVNVKPQTVSATDVRRRVARHEPIAGLVPPAVEHHIHQHQLYRSTPH